MTTTTLANPATAEVLTGADLLALVKEMPEASKSDLVRAAGYVSIKKDGTERINFTAFYEALLNAKGFDFGANTGGGRPGRQLSYGTKVQFNGNLMVGRAYVAQMGFNPGDEFQIKLGKNKRQIVLVPIGAEEGEV
jgi:hypothetical protein